MAYMVDFLGEDTPMPPTADRAAYMREYRKRNPIYTERNRARTRICNKIRLAREKAERLEDQHEKV